MKLDYYHQKLNEFMSCRTTENLKFLEMKKPQSQNSVGTAQYPGTAHASTTAAAQRPAENPNNHPRWNIPRPLNIPAKSSIPDPRQGTERTPPPTPPPPPPPPPPPSNPHTRLKGWRAGNPESNSSWTSEHCLFPVRGLLKKPSCLRGQKKNITEFGQFLEPALLANVYVALHWSPIHTFYTEDGSNKQYATIKKLSLK